MEFLNFEINEKTFRNIAIGIGVIIIIYMAFTMNSLVVLKSYSLGATTSVNDEEIRTHIDSLDVGPKKIEITGYAYKEGESIKSVDSYFVLKNQDNEKMYLMKTVMEKKQELKEIGCENAGLHAQCMLFGLPKGRYQIMVLYRNNNEDILADTLIPFEI